MKPGSVSSAERVLPPIVSCASSTRTECPACAIVIAAESPLGPDPTTNASNWRLEDGTIRRDRSINAERVLDGHHTQSLLSASQRVASESPNGLVGLAVLRKTDQAGNTDRKQSPALFSQLPSIRVLGQDRGDRAKIVERIGAEAGRKSV